MKKSFLSSGSGELLRAIPRSPFDPIKEGVSVSTEIHVAPAAEYSFAISDTSNISFSIPFHGLAFFISHTKDILPARVLSLIDPKNDLGVPESLLTLFINSFSESDL